MFFSLLRKECEMWGKNVLLYIFIIMIFMFYTTQMGSENDISKPVENNDGYYGYNITTDETDIMNETIYTLVREYSNNSYSSYPLMFYKEKKLSPKESDEVAKILETLLGKDETQWESDLDEYYNSVSEKKDEVTGIVEVVSQQTFPLCVDSDVKYSDFLAMMSQVESYVGNGSNYSLASMQNIAVPMTYQQALENYEKTISINDVASAYARLFCDYTGILLGIVPAFFAITRVYKDKKNQVSQVVNCKKVSTLKLVCSKYLAMVIMTFIPVLILSILPLIHATFVSNINGVQTQYYIFAIYCFGWLLPTILFVVAFAYFFASLFENLLPILFSILLWFISIASSASTGLINAGYNLIPRFNELGSYDKFEKILPQLIENRIIYSVASILIVGLIIIVVSKKRVGRLQFNAKLFKHTKG